MGNQPVPLRLIAIIAGLSGLIALTVRCTHEPRIAGGTLPPSPYGTTYIPPSPQRDGDAEAGREYLLYGDYMDAGIPLEAYMAVVGPRPANVLERTGDNALLDFEVTAVNAPNGVRVVSQNCLKCHGGYVNGNFVLGLGAAHYDYTFDYSALEPATSAVIRQLYGEESPEWEAYDPFRKSGRVIGPYLVTEVFGVNPADKIWIVLSAHRDPHTLAWSEEPLMDIPEELVPTDVPPWWNLKKKHAMFYTGYGTGDFSRIMMASSLLTLNDSAHARRIDDRFNDVYAYLRTLEPPAWPWQTDAGLAAAGETVFRANCASCHGTYGEAAAYPNLFVSLDQVGTDPALAHSYLDHTGFVNWFNDGWFRQGPHGAELQPRAGYVAPPLDGIWASAPYLHNGSVPTLYGLLNSASRPVFWRRNFNSLDYDREKVGWQYEVKSFKVDKKTYDTTLPGYGNGGHTYGDHLSGDQRLALLEYLKTL